MTRPDRQDDVAAFEDFFERHHRELSRFAYVLTGDHGSADDLTGDAFLAVWRQWQRVQDRDEPLAYVRRMVLNMAASRVRQRVRERRRDGQVSTIAPVEAAVPDGAAVLDVRAALLQLPVRRRACVALRYALDLSEQEVAAVSDGRVFSARQALPLKLVDELGSERDAIAWLERDKQVQRGLPVRDWKPKGPSNFSLWTAAALGADLAGLERAASLIRQAAGATAASELSGLLALWQPPSGDR